MYHHALAQAAAVTPATKSRGAVDPSSSSLRGARAWSRALPSRPPQVRAAVRAHAHQRAPTHTNTHQRMTDDDDDDAPLPVSSPSPSLAAYSNRPASRCSLVYTRS